VAVLVRPRIEWVVEVKLRLTVLVETMEPYRLSDHRFDRALVFLRQSIQERSRQRQQNDLITGVRLIVTHPSSQRISSISQTWSVASAAIAK
jgi:hypothetical protein